MLVENTETQSCRDMDENTETQSCRDLDENTDVETWMRTQM